MNRIDTGERVAVLDLGKTNIKVLVPMKMARRLKCSLIQTRPMPPALISQ